MENWNWTLSGTETMWNTHAWNQFSPTCRANKGKDRCGLHASLSYCQARVPNLSWPSPNEATSPPTNNFSSCFTLKTWPVSVLLSIILSVLYFYSLLHCNNVITIRNCWVSSMCGLKTVDQIRACPQCTQVNTYAISSFETDTIWKPI